MAGSLKEQAKHVRSVYPDGTTNRVFNSISEAALYYRCSRNVIRKAIASKAWNPIDDTRLEYTNDVPPEKPKTKAVKIPIDIDLYQRVVATAEAYVSTPGKRRRLVDELLRKLLESAIEQNLDVNQFLVPKLPVSAS